MAENDNTLNLKKPRPLPYKGSVAERADKESHDNGTPINTIGSQTINKQKKEPRIGFGSSFLMIITAIFFDSVQMIFGAIGLIPVIGTVLGGLLSFMTGFFAWLTFYTWFKIHKVSFIRPQRLVAILGAGFIELVPFLNALPAWTLAVMFLIASAKIEDETGLNLLKITAPASSGNVKK